MTPKTNIIYPWRHQDTQNKSMGNPESFPKVLFLEIAKMKLQHVEIVGKDGARQIPKIRPKYLGNIENGINIFQKARNGIWEYGVNILKKQERICWTVETLQL